MQWTRDESRFRDLFFIDMGVPSSPTYQYLDDP
jgi:hypothetical protein